MRTIRLTWNGTKETLSKLGYELVEEDHSTHHEQRADYYVITDHYCPDGRLAIDGVESGVYFEVAAAVRK